MDWIGWPVYDTRRRDAEIPAVRGLLLGPGARHGGNA